MANNLSYQQARKIRKTRFTDLFVDQLAQKDTGVLGAVGRTISLRTSARLKGYKEKFDPLNIAKFLTFGSKLGPALYGKMMGRSQKDIDYFTNRTRAIKGGNNTADRIGPSPDTGMQGINEQLAKIYDFLKSSREDDTKQQQLENNSEEELSNERERRHRELIETLKKLVKNMGGATTVTATAEQDNSFLNMLWQKLKGLADVVMSLKDAMIEIAKKLGLPLVNGLMKLGRWGWLAAANPIGAVVIGGTVLGTGLVNQLESMTDEQLEQLANSGDTTGTSEAASIILNSRNKTEADRILQDERYDRINQLLEEKRAPWYLRLYGSEEDKRRFLEKQGERKTDLDQLFPEVPTGPEPVNPRERRGTLQRQPNSQQVPNPPTTPNDDGPDFTNTPISKAAPVQRVASGGTTINNLSRDNTVFSSPPIKSNTPSVTTASNTVVNSASQNKGLSVIQIAVRNTDETFRDLLEQSVFA